MIQALKKKIEDWSKSTFQVKLCLLPSYVLAFLTIGMFSDNSQNPFRLWREQNTDKINQDSRLIF